MQTLLIASLPLLSAKQIVPPPRPAGVIRMRLHEQLLASNGTRLTVVVAAAGWGKTTLLSQWAHDPQERRPIAWVSLDEADDEPVRFWTYALSALRSVAPELGSESVSTLLVPGVDPLDVALPSLLNDLSVMTEQHVLVLDDYHVLRDTRIHEGMEFLLSYLPSSLHIVISGRSDPPLALARLRARGELTELRAVELRFNVDEAAALVSLVRGEPLGLETAADLVERTEGWAVGLQLAALTLRGKTDLQAAVAAIRGDDRHILDYFAAEVLTALPDDQRELLIRTAVLDRLCGSLCDSVLEREGSGAILEELDRADMFVVALDRQREWYRCHHLFRDVLRRQLQASDAGAIPALLQRASDWFLAHGQVEAAIRHRGDAGDDAGALRLLASSFGWFLDHGSVATFLQLGDRLAATTTDPRLCLLFAWAAGQCGRVERAGAWLDAAEANIDDSSPPFGDWTTMRGQIEAMRATMSETAEADAEQALRHAQLAVELETDPSTEGYVVARTALGGALMGADRTEEAVDALSDAWCRPARRHVLPFVQLQAAGLLANALLRVGRVGDAQRLCNEVAAAARATEETQGDGAAAAVTLLHMAEGRLAYRAGDIELARERLRRAVELASIWSRPTNHVGALMSLAEAELAAGDRAAARNAIERAKDVAANEAILPIVARELDEVDARIGRGAARAARRTGQLYEELTDRELSILRPLQGTATQREIAAELYLSINTVKGYTKTLYRKLAVASREDAVARARELGLI